jgi:malonyl-CoA decarboxylase
MVAVSDGPGDHRPGDHPAGDHPAGEDLGRLVDRRADLLAGDAGPASNGNGNGGGGEELAALTEELRTALGSAAPTVRRVHADDPDGLPARLADREPVHPVRDAEDLADRLAADRRLFALEHPALRGRPLNVVWVALCRGVPDRIEDVLDPAAATLDAATADTAVFYSIWNAEPGLEGLGRGRTLIEGAVGLLRAELPGITTFTTLSPVPGFRRWLEGRRPAGLSPDALAACCATYLVGLDGRGRPVDPVARFHLGNGARLWRILPSADGSERGQDRSFGVMANYRYEPEDRAANRRELAAGFVPVSEAVRALLERDPGPTG